MIYCILFFDLGHFLRPHKRLEGESIQTLSLSGRPANRTIDAWTKVQDANSLNGKIGGSIDGIMIKKWENSNHKMNLRGLKADEADIP